MSGQLIKVSLPHECTIYEVAQWQQNIITQWANQSTPLKFDLAEVKEMDASFVQLLLSCQKTAHHHGATCTLDNIPAAVEERLQQMHVYELLVDEAKQEESNDG